MVFDKKQVGIHKYHRGNKPLALLGASNFYNYLNGKRVKDEI